MFPYSKKDQRATEPTWRELKKAEKKAAEYKLTSDNASIASSSISAEKEKAHSEYAKKLSSRFKVSSLLYVPKNGHSELLLMH